METSVFQACPSAEISAGPGGGAAPGPGQMCFIAPLGEFMADELIWL